MTALAEHGVTGRTIRIADHDVKPGVKTDMGDGDEWPQIRAEVLGSDILVLSTPIWLGHPSSIAQRVLERLDAELGESDDEGRMLTYGKVAAVCVVGNEDGAHKVSSDLFQGLNDIGFSLAPNAVTYWVGAAMQGSDYQDLERPPKRPPPPPERSRRTRPTSPAGSRTRHTRRAETPSDPSAPLTPRGEHRACLRQP
ncbi:NADPH-dependent FMN reductase [Streptomyces griseofuscus]|uniref:NADPH-dependent FMN reductase n=1 Tax=Streptomyces griseofuscus TaxID=146922 RepID=A0A7H1QCH6_9ACTN|nr:NADPH-dependent FMN reductase [Streptomyces griseofuscus]BBC98640.1 flavodoxin [Streptomyces rochei]